MVSFAPFCAVATVVIEVPGRVPQVFFVDHQGQLSTVPHLLPLPEALAQAGGRWRVLGRRARSRIH